MSPLVEMKKAVRTVAQHSPADLDAAKGPRDKKFPACGIQNETTRRSQAREHEPEGGENIKLESRGL